jgi:Arc/MetJ family transcription regulator
VTVAKHLIEVDEDALEAARVELGTTTVADTVNEALRRSADDRARKVKEAIDALAAMPAFDRDDAWR